MSIKKINLSIAFFTLVFVGLNAQQHLDPEYIEVTNKRASKIVGKLELTDSEKEVKVVSIVAKQYQNLSEIHDGRDANIDAIKKNVVLIEEKQNKKIDKLKAKANKQLNKLHKSFLKQLAVNLSEEKIEAIKDGMTYGVLPKTYKAFLEMIPSLTTDEKDYIYNNLKEAREYAIDGGSSKEKHAWFGKYKGRINNYLSERGYDLEKERDGWYERIEEQKSKK